VADTELRTTLFQRFSRERLATLQDDCQELATTDAAKDELKTMLEEFFGDDDDDGLATTFEDFGL